MESKQKQFDLGAFFNDSLVVRVDKYIAKHFNISHNGIVSFQLKYFVDNSPFNDRLNTIIWRFINSVLE